MIMGMLVAPVIRWDVHLVMRCQMCVKEFSVRVERLEANFYRVHTGYIYRRRAWSCTQHPGLDPWTWRMDIFFGHKMP